ncbi:ABM domain containing protein [Pyrenophora tritici-repentis]|uniref:ABM multi-domain protein n=2 Tax=Pyrenophora tritici-repentis TaxID=45151 RepID=A0A2W1EEV3_9PLEO|nr:uncharacterized protein PTRG_06448 [Pyrenophora tritici-repentis Pt-1C-BFP]KAA8613521.1 hypothetical protein PtrV1_12429 [Pyrenophora tritici-repentis]EDU49368.1 conserved hypothetical protein [Pyrenophora tritici-repentis Pt-1C-BFP]KAF7445233.1 hypothetical protein A1F99_102190 [Pyrenophora tritici-repentis]KAF7565498.1 ABM multi-domain protein [Pyrenophora tritici-repentis]KAG9380369.1 hypothetical protein A1F94_009264 [Pyrenophora tritici-repentis]
MSEPITEVAYLPLKPSLDLSSGEAKEVWQSTLRTIASQPGFKTGYWGKQIENPDTLQLVIDWDSLSSHQAFMSSPAYTPFLETLGDKILGGSPTLIHISFSSSPTPSSEPLSAPVTECINSFFEPTYDQSHYTTQFSQFGEKAAAIPGVKAIGLAGGWSVEKLPHENLGEGVEGNVFNVFIGWPSVEAHMEFRGTQHFGEVIPMLRDGPKTMKMWHVAFEKFE